MIEIRFFEKQDTESAVKIFCELSEYYLKGNKSTEDEVRRNLINSILGKDSGVKLILAVENGRALALATVSLLYPAPKETGQLCLKELFTSSKYQGKGIGRRMMSFIANYAIEKNCSRMDWATDLSNTMGMEFYRKLGASSMEGRVNYRAEGEFLSELAKYV